MFDKSKCNLCGDCFERCPYVDYDKEKAVEQITALTEGKDAEILRGCITCAACNEYCPPVANPFDLICELQEKMGVRPAPSMVYKSTDLAIYGIPDEIIRGDPKKPVLSICVIELYLPGVLLEGQLFDDLTIVKGSKYFAWMGCCHTGQVSLIREHAQAFVDNLAALEAKEIVFLHYDDYAMFKMVKDFGIKVPFRPVHYFEYLLGYLKEHPGSITKLDRKVAYQRPCAARYAPDVDPLVDEIFELIGVERVEREYDREGNRYGLCCLALHSPPFEFPKPEKTKKFQDLNLDDAKEHGAEAIVFSCPLCYMALADGTARRNMVPIFFTDLCRMGLGEKRFPVVI